MAKLLLFFVLIIGLTYLIDVMVHHGLRRIPTSSFGSANKVFNGTVNADIVISGSSRALVHYDPRIIHSVTERTAFNIGRNGSQTDMQLAVLRSYLSHNTKPKLVIHNLDLYSATITRHIYDPAQYLPYLHDSSLYAGVIRIHPEAWKWKHIPLYGYLVEDMRFTWITGLKGFFGFYPPEDHYLGYVPRRTLWTNEFESFRINNPNGVRFEIDPRGLSDLEAIAATCRDHGIPLLFVFSPEYLEMQALERNRAEILATFTNLAVRFHAPLWDYSGHPISSDKHNFYNSQHLNETGATRFSLHLAREIANSGLLAR